MKNGLLIINLGTPDAPTPKALRRYLKPFLSDPRVMDINPLLRWLLVYVVILPFRAPQSAKAYKKIWTREGSPLMVHTQKLRDQISQGLKGEWIVEMGMRCGNPSIETGLKRLMQQGADRITILPLYPQYASATTGTTIEEVYRVTSPLWNLPSIRIIPPFYDQPGFIQTHVQIAKDHLSHFRQDHLLFSFHGLPKKHIEKSKGLAAYCYESQCTHTAKVIAQGLGLKKERYSLAFQSRLGRSPWIQPYTDEEIVRLGQSGVKRLAVMMPSFVADCLETLEEIGLRGKELALSHGVEEFELIPTLNAHPEWVRTICHMVSHP
jgi:protoporphyrin/coproporphyrin ferrochelatase